MTRDDWRQAHKLINIMVEANQVLIYDRVSCIPITYLMSSKRVRCYRLLLFGSQEVPDELADMAERYQEFRDRNGYNKEGGRGGRRGGVHICYLYYCRPTYYQRGGRLDTCKTDTSVLFFIL